MVPLPCLRCDLPILEPTDVPVTFGKEVLEAQLAAAVSKAAQQAAELESLKVRAGVATPGAEWRG